MSTASVGTLEFHDAPNAQDASAVTAAEGFLAKVNADHAPEAVIQYAESRVAALKVNSAQVAPPQSTKFNSASAPTEITVTEADLERLLAKTQATLQTLQAQSYVTSNKRQVQAQIDACRTGIAACDASIARFDASIEASLTHIDELIEQPLQVAMFGVPLTSEANAKLQGAAVAFVQLRQARWKQRQSRTSLEARLADLLRVQARFAA